MITALRLGNARLFDGDGWNFPFNSLTALCGTNSAGKSTALKALLLLRLNISTRNDLDLGRAKLRFSGSGSQVDLGNFKSFISHNQVTAQLHLGVSISTNLSVENMHQIAPQRQIDPDDDEEVPYVLNCDFYFGLPQGRQESLPLSGAANELIDDLAIDEQAVLHRSEFRIEDVAGEELLSFSIGMIEGELAPRRAYNLTLPRRVIQTAYPKVSETIYGDSDTLQVPTVLRGLLPDRWNMIPGTGPEAAAEFLARPLPLPPVMEEVFNDLRRELNSISYLGPLRAAAKRYYTLQQDYNLAGDTTGEFLPYLLRERPNQTVFHASPIDYQPMRSGLSTALDYWLYYLRTGKMREGYGRELNVSSYQDVLVQLQIRSSYDEKRHSLTDTGFGYSQVLPILARGLLMPSSSTLIIEQPELHLNPALQIRLADFFIALSVTGKQVIIETHSEHLIDAIRARSAEDLSGQVANNCMILFLDSTGDKPKLVDLRVKQDGTIPEWPLSFFGEGPQTSARILRAQRLHRSKQLQD